MGLGAALSRIPAAVCSRAPARANDFAVIRHHEDNRYGDRFTRPPGTSPTERPARGPEMCDHKDTAQSESEGDLQQGQVQHGWDAPMNIGVTKTKAEGFGIICFYMKIRREEEP